MPRNDLIQLRSDTAANWVSVNPTLAVGEIGFETDTGKFKIGALLTYAIGDIGPGGGKIFITPSTAGNSTGKYFEVAPVATEVQRTWATDTNSNQTTAVTGADGTAIGTGAQNTIDIVNQGNVAATSAAVYCSDLVFGGKSDWFLPSKDEIQKMGLYQSQINTSFSNANYYWTSSEYAAGSAWYFWFNGLPGVQNETLKGNAFLVRPVRAFTVTTQWEHILYATDASDLAGIIPSARISGSYTGITGVGTLTAGTWNASVVAGQYGGTGVANTGKTITLGGNLTTSGAFTTTLTATANTSLTLPSSGTVISTANLSSITAVNNSVNIGTLGNITTDAYAVVLSNTNYPTLTTRIGEHYTVSGVGTANNDFTIFSNATVRIKYVNNTIATFNSTGVTATTFTGALSGNASTATNLSTNRTNWSGGGTISAVVGQLAWKNYGDSHTIFDASQSTSPNGGAVNNTNATNAWTGTYPTLMGWNGTSTYGVRVDSARTSDNTTGNAATATTAGSSSATTFTSSRFQGTYSTLDSSHYNQALRGGNGGNAAGMALWVSGIACQFRVGTGEDKVYLMNADNTAPSTFRAIIDAVSSVHFKQDIKTFPMLVNAAGSAVNEEEIESGLNIIRQLRPVTYRWKEKSHLYQLPSSPRRALALSRLNKIRSSKGLEPYESDELQHDCSRDDCNGNAENPCSRVKNWENGNIGFIAQEVGAIIPQAANLDKDGEYSGLDNLALTAIAVASIKELDATIQALTERIKQLEESNV